MIRHKRTIEQKFKAIVAMIVAMGLVSGFTLHDGTISDAWSATDFPEHTTHTCTGDITEAYNGYDSDSDSSEHWETCNVCGAESTHHALNFTSHYGHHTDGLDYPICDDCGWYDTSVSGIACSYRYSCDPVEDIDGNPTTHTLICTQCGVDGGSAPHNTPSPTPIEGECHEYTCSDCGYNYSAPCDPTYQMKDATHHSVRCIACGRDDTVKCDYDDDGFCKDCESEAIRRLDAAKSAVKELYDTAKTDHNWLDEYGNPGKEDEARLWLQNLSQADFEALFEKKQGFDTKYDELFDITKTETLDKVLEKMEEYMETIPSVYTLTELVEPGNKSTYPTPQPVTINIFEKDTSNPVDAVLEITGTGVSPFKCDLKNGYTISLVSGATSKLTPGPPTTLTLANDTYTITNKTTANGYKPFESDDYKFTTDYSTSPYFSGLTNAPKDWVLKSPSAGVLNIYIEPLPEVKVELVKSDAPGTPLTSGATIKLTDNIISTPIEYNPSTDKIVVGTPSSNNISKSGNVITIKSVENIEVLEGTTPSGYEWGTGDSIFQASATDPTVLIASGTANRHTVEENKLTVKFTKIPVITAKFLEKTTNTALTGCSVKLQSKTNPTQSVIFEPGDTIHVGTPTGGADISKAGTVVTIKAEAVISILSNIAPLYHENLENETFEFKSDAIGAITLSGGGGTGAVTSPTTSELDFFFDKAPTFKFTTIGDGAPSKTGLKITEKFGAKRTFTVDSATSPSVELADGEYSVTTTSAAKGYKSASGTFTIASGTVSSASGSYSGACEYKSDDTVNIKFTKDDKIPDIKVYKYPKKDGKDEPDTKKDALKGWSYTVEMYDGDETTDEKVVKDTKSSNWDEVDKISVTSSASKDYDTLDTSKLTVESYYRIKTGTDTYAYFYINSDGTVKEVKGNIDTNDDGDEVYLWDDDPDEDSDDVIAIHKVNNTGTNLSGAHLQIYLYSDSNTLVYGSSSSSTNRSTSSSTTKAKTTPAKPSVATNDVKFDWTTTDKAKVIDIGDLEKGKNYTLREVSAPSGYETPAYDFVFKYGTDGKLTIVRNYNGLLSVTGNKLVLKNLTPTEAAATRPKTGDHSKLALWLDICIVMLGGLYLSGYSIFESFTEKKKVKVVAKKKPHNRRKR